MARRLVGRRAVLLLWAFVCADVPGQGWPQWRGAARDSTATTPSFSWPKELARKWTVRVGDGLSSPVVLDNRVFVLSRDGDRELVRAISLEAGTEHWRDDYPTTYVSRPEAARVGVGPRSTPVVTRERVFTFGATGVLSSYDAGSGKLRWRRHTSAEFDNTALRYGVSMSPLIERDLLIAHVGHEQAGALVAYDAHTGEPRWRVAGCRPSYSSPVIAEFANVRQAVVVCYRSIAGVALDTGRVLWEQPYEPLKYPHSLTPVVYGDTILMSGSSKGLTSFRVSPAAGGWRVEQAWRTDSMSMTLSSPAIHGDYLYGLADRNRGQFVCVDARTGAVVWTSQGREGEMASILTTGKQILFLNDQGQLTIANADPRRLNIVATYALADALTWTMPALVSRQLIVKHGDELTRWEVPAT